MSTGWNNAPYAGSAWVTNVDAGIARKLQQERSGFGAIAYSFSTGRCGRSFGLDDQASAESFALQSCGAADAFVAVWGQNTYIALAVAPDGSWGWGYDGRAKLARKRALTACTGQKARIVAVVDTRTG